MRVQQSVSNGSLFQEHRVGVILQSLDHLLAMAQTYRSEGSLRQATEIYLMLSEDHADTAQGQGAQDRLLEVADVYESIGCKHEARAVYERLL